MKWVVKDSADPNKTVIIDYDKEPVHLGQFWPAPEGVDNSDGDIIAFDNDNAVIDTVAEAAKQATKQADLTALNEKNQEKASRVTRILSAKKNFAILDGADKDQLLLDLAKELYGD